MTDDAVALKVMLEEQRRLMRQANRAYVELEVRLAKAEKGHKLYKRLFEKNSKFLRTTLERLEGSSWENEQELRITLNRHGNHLRTCKVIQLGNYYMEPVECDCGWTDEKAVLALLDQFSEQNEETTE